MKNNGIKMKGTIPDHHIKIKFMQMKKIIFSSCLLLVTFALQAQTEKEISRSDIREVKVYLSGAYVERSARVSVDGGTSTVLFSGLSAAINPQSINVSGTGDVTILSVVHQLNYLNSEKKSTEIVQLEDSLDNLTRKREQLLNFRSVLQEEQTMVLANKSVKGDNTGLNTKEVEALADFYRKRLSDIKDKMSDNGYREKKLNEQIAKVQQQLNVLNNKRSQPTSNILVTVSAKQRTSASFEFSYLVNNAGWSPVYDIRAKDSNSPVQLGYKAMVFQSTGEDWDKVKLKLSTVNPTISNVKPELQSWYLDFYVPVIMYKNRVNEVSQGVMMEAVPSAKDKNQRDADDEKQMNTAASYVQVNNNQLEAEFDIAFPYSIPSDNKQYMVEIQQTSLPATYNYYAVPKLDKDAFLTASVTGWEDLNLISGPASIYFENNYVGETYIETRNTNDTLQLSLGRDKRVIITREKQKDFSSSKVLGFTKTKTLTYEITIKNLKKESINIIVEEQIPISKNKDIEVKVNEDGGADTDPATGKLVWKLNVKPGEPVKKKLSFTVKYPKDKVLNNL